MSDTVLVAMISTFGGILIAVIPIVRDWQKTASTQHQNQKIKELTKENEKLRKDNNDLRRQILMYKYR